jgi:hypothetical protein
MRKIKVMKQHTWVAVLVPVFAMLAAAVSAAVGQDKSAAPVPALGGLIFADDFSADNGAWKYGNRECAPKDGALRLPFDRRILWATLSGRTLNPGNLSEFTMDLRCSFSGDDKRKLVVGFAKPYEWGAMSECKGRMEVEETGKYRLIWDGKLIQENQLTRDEQGRFELILYARKGMLKVDDHASVSLESSDFSGHVMVATEGNRVKGSAVLIDELSVRSAGQHQPWSEQELQANIEAWLNQRLDVSDEWLVKLKEAVDSARAAGTYGYGTALRVEPSLVKPGEKVTAVFEKAKDGNPGGAAYALADFLRNDGTDRRELKLDWVTGADGRQRAEVVFHPDVPGNWSIVWESPQGTMRRLIGVVKPGYMAVRFHITGHPELLRPIRYVNRPPIRQSYDLIHERGLAADFWAPLTRVVYDPLQAHVRAAGIFLDLQQRYGDGLMPKVEGDYCIQNPESNLHRLPETVQERILAWSLKQWNTLGWNAPDSIASYTHGHATTRIAERLGLPAFDALCEWTNWEDAGWEINHTGAPPVPYYIAHDDFRKVGKPGIMLLSQGTASSVRQYTVFANESHPNLTFMRLGTTPDLKLGRQEKNIDRFEAVIDGFYEQAKMHTDPFFFTVGLENFSNIEDWNRPNILGVDYLIKKAATADIVFVQAKGIIDYYNRHYTKQPESWFFWPDYYAGLMKQPCPKPRVLVDRIEVVNDRYHTEHQQGMTLPRYWWDHTVKWDNPEWVEASHLRGPSGIIPPNQLTEENIVPKIVPVSGIRADITRTKSAGGMTFEIRIHSDREVDLLPLAVWDIPLQAESCKETTSRDLRFLPILDGSSGNLHGIVECSNVPAGTSTRIVQVQGVPREPVQTTVAIGDSIQGRSFLRGDTPHVYLGMTKGKNTKVSVIVPPGRTVYVQYNDESRVEPVDGKLEIKLNNEWPPFNPAWCPRIVGMTAKEVEAQSAIIHGL